MSTSEARRMLEEARMISSDALFKRDRVAIELEIAEAVYQKTREVVWTLEKVQRGENPRIAVDEEADAG